MKRVEFLHVFIYLNVFVEKEICVEIVTRFLCRF